MANANEHDKCAMLTYMTPKLRQKYKTWCSENNISMNTGIVSFMQTVTAKKKKRYKVQQRVLELSK